jgi:O-antigen/teichoic acid export membrane protein
MSSGKLQGLFKQSMVYWIGTMLSKMIGFLLIPLYTRYLLPKDYGTLELIALTADVLAILIGAQITTAVFKFYHQEKEQSYKKAVISTSIAGIAVIAGISFFVLGLNAVHISSFLFGHADNAVLLQLMFLGYFFSVLEEVPLAYLRLQDKAKTYVVITMFQIFMMIGLNIYFVAVMNYGVFGILLGMSISFSITCIVLLYKTFIVTGFEVVFAKLFSMLRYSAPLIPATLSMFVINFSDRYFLNYYTSLDDVGIYSLAYKFGFILTPLVVTPFYLIWQSKMFEFYEDENRTALYNNVMSVFLFMVCCGYLAIAGYIDDALRIMVTDKYYSAGLYVPIIAAAYLFNGINQMFLAPLYAEKKTKRIGLINAMSAGLNVALNYLLIPVYGIIGAAAATLASFVFISILTIRESNKVSGIRWEWSRYMKVILVTFVCVILLGHIHIDNLVASIMTKTIILISAFFVLVISGYFTNTQLKYIKSFVLRG